MTQRAVLHRAVLAVRSDAPRCDAMQQEYFYPGSGGASCEKPIIINMPLPEKALSREFRNLLKDQVRPLVALTACVAEQANPKQRLSPSGRLRASWRSPAQCWHFRPLPLRPVPIPLKAAPT